MKNLYQRLFFFSANSRGICWKKTASDINDNVIDNNVDHKVWYHYNTIVCTAQQLIKAEYESNFELTVRSSNNAFDFCGMNSNSKHIYK